jgi:hypothetical protein
MMTKGTDPERSYPHGSTPLTYLYSIHILRPWTIKGRVEKMGITALADLDELILLSRDEKARTYILEAVACYRSGAYRASIVSTWIAVCYDIIDKLHELALSGDKEAERQVAQIEETRANNDPMRALKIERTLLDIAKDKFELISPLEHLDLTRLQEDRNRCAHPSMISQEQKFNPPAELARLHIQAAVIHLLQHEPAQGKQALERLTNEVQSEYFPIEIPKAVTSLSSGPLKRARESLTRNFVTLLLKKALEKASDWKQPYRIFAALAATKQLQPHVFEKTLREKLPQLLNALADSHLNEASDFVIKFPDCWDYLPASNKNKIEAFIATLDDDSFINIVSYLNFNPLKVAAKQRLARSTWKDTEIITIFDDHPLVHDHRIKLYLSSNSFDEANEKGKSIKKDAERLSASQQRRILAGIAKNNQLQRSFETPSLIQHFYDSNVIPQSEFMEILDELGLSTMMEKKKV